MKRFIRFASVCAVALPFWYGAIVYPIQNITGKTPAIPEMKQFGPFGSQPGCEYVMSGLQTLYQHGNDGTAFLCWSDTATPTPTP